MRWLVLVAALGAAFCAAALLAQHSGGGVDLLARTPGTRSVSVVKYVLNHALTSAADSAAGGDNILPPARHSRPIAHRTAPPQHQLPSDGPETVGWYLAMGTAALCSALLALRASQRADRHRTLAMATTIGAPTGRGSPAMRRPTQLEAAAAPGSMTPGTPVPTKTILVVGATGTLGRQVVRQALDAGYDVRCLVRPRPNPADFLRDWGAKVVNGNLASPKTLPAALVGVHTVVDCATARPEESIQQVDWEGKKALIKCAKAMGIQRYIFFSIVDCDKAPDVPLMEIKRCTELYLQQVGLNYTVLRACGFMQALIQQYAVPMLEGEEVYGTQDATRIAYLSTQDAARMALACVQNDQTVGQTLTLAGPQAYTVTEVIRMCEKLGGVDAKVKDVPVGLLGALRRFTGLFEWSKDVSDRLAFSELLSNNKEFSASMEGTYRTLGMDPSETQTLESYLNEYYRKMLVRLKEVKAKSGQKGIYL